MNGKDPAIASLMPTDNAVFAALQRSFSPQQIEILMTVSDPAFSLAREVVEQVADDRAPTSQLRVAQRQFIREATRVLDTAQSIQGQIDQVAAVSYWSHLFEPWTLAKRLGIGAGVGAG